MIPPGAIIFRVVHVPRLRHEYLIEDGDKPKWGSDRAAALFFPTHRAADDRAKQLRTHECWVASIVVERDTEPPDLPDEFLDPVTLPPRHRRVQRPPVKLFGYA